MKKNDITTSARKQQTAEELSPELLEPAFYLSECRSLQIDTRKLGDNKAAGYLTRSVARRPENLLAQIQRANIHLTQRDAEGVYGSLLDLFITLNNKGRSIRQRMLLRAKPLLTEEQFQALAERLDTGISATDPMPLSTQSVLSKGLTGTRQLIVRIDDNGNETTNRDPLEEAIEYLEYSQIEKAREILEKAVLDNPSRMELHNNLLTIYRVSGDQGSFTVMLDRLNALKFPVPEEWKRLAEHFATRSE